MDSIEQEWGYLERESDWQLAALFALVGILPIVLDRWLLDAYQVDVLGLILLATAGSSYWLTRSNRPLGILVLASGTTIAATLAAYWLPGRGIAVLLVLPVSLAVLMLEPKTSVAITIGVAWLMLARPWGAFPGTSASEAGAIVFVIIMMWIVGCIRHSPQRAVLSHLLRYYQRAQTLLEEARDRRLALNQANQDLTDAYQQLARMNDLLRASRLEAEMARRAKEEFVANVSHELRTPLNMIIGFSEMILHSPATYGPRLPRALLSDMGVIHRNSQHLAQLINDVLDLSQLEARRMSLSRELVDVGALVAEAIEAVSPLYRAKRLELEADIPASLPRLLCDRLRVRQILLNLLSNAGRFTTTGGVKVTVSLDRSDVVLSVADSGPGIPPEQRQRLFEPFTQLDSTTRRIHDGSGLGLSISKQLVELHGGRMWLESEVGKGSTFYFSLPLDPVQAGQPDAARWVNPYTTYEPRTRRRVAELPQPQPRILVLEPEDVLCHQIGAYLGDVHADRVETAEALKAGIAANPPDIVLINDDRTTEGKDLVRMVAGLPARMPVVSCYVPGKREACDQLHVVDYLVKPVSHTDLLATAERVAPEDASLLIVEDDRELSQLLARQLAAAGRGYRVLRAEDGAKALAMMRMRQPDAVFLDLGLPDQDGYQVLREKDADETIRHIPVVIVSARDPLGGAVITSRLQVELAGGLSARDVILCLAAISQALSPVKQ